MNIEKQLATSLQAQEAAAERCYAATQKLLAAALQAAFSREGGSAAGRQALDGVLKTPVNGRSFEEKEGVLVETSDGRDVIGRTHREAPEIDGIVAVPSTLAVGSVAIRYSPAIVQIVNPDTG